MEYIQKAVSYSSNLFSFVVSSLSPIRRMDYDEEDEDVIIIKDQIPTEDISIEESDGDSDDNKDGDVNNDTITVTEGTSPSLSLPNTNTTILLLSNIDTDVDTTTTGMHCIEKIVKEEKEKIDSEIQDEEVITKKESKGNSDIGTTDPPCGDEKSVPNLLLSELQQKEKEDPHYELTAGEGPLVSDFNNQVIFQDQQQQQGGDSITLDTSSSPSSTPRPCVTEETWCDISISDPPKEDVVIISPVAGFGPLSTSNNDDNLCPLEDGRGEEGQEKQEVGGKKKNEVEWEEKQTLLVAGFASGFDDTPILDTNEVQEVIRKVEEEQEDMHSQQPPYDGIMVDTNNMESDIKEREEQVIVEQQELSQEESTSTPSIDLDTIIVVDNTMVTTSSTLPSTHRKVEPSDIREVTAPSSSDSDSDDYIDKSYSGQSSVELPILDDLVVTPSPLVDELPREEDRDGSSSSGSLFSTTINTTIATTTTTANNDRDDEPSITEKNKKQEKTLQPKKKKQKKSEEVKSKITPQVGVMKVLALPLDNKKKKNKKEEQEDGSTSSTDTDEGEDDDKEKKDVNSKGRIDTPIINERVQTSMTVSSSEEEEEVICEKPKQQQKVPSSISTVQAPPPSRKRKNSFFSSGSNNSDDGRKGQYDQFEDGIGDALRELDNALGEIDDFINNPPEEKQEGGDSKEDDDGTSRSNTDGDDDSSSSSSSSSRPSPRSRRQPQPPPPYTFTPATPSSKSASKRSNNDHSNRVQPHRQKPSPHSKGGDNSNASNNNKMVLTPYERKILEKIVSGTKEEQLLWTKKLTPRLKKILYSC